MSFTSKSKVGTKPDLPNDIMKGPAMENLSCQELSILFRQLLLSCPNMSEVAHSEVWKRAITAAHRQIATLNPIDALTILHSVVQRIEVVRLALMEEGKMSDDGARLRSSPTPPTKDEMESLLSLLPGENSLIQKILPFFTDEKLSQLEVSGLGLLLALCARLHSRNVPLVESIGQHIRQKLLEQKIAASSTTSFLSPAFFIICINSLQQLHILHIPLCDALCDSLPLDCSSHSGLRRILRGLNKLGYSNHRSLIKAVQHLNTRLEQQFEKEDHRFGRNSVQRPFMSNSHFVALIDAAILSTVHDVRATALVCHCPLLRFL